MRLACVLIGLAVTSALLAAPTAAQALEATFLGVPVVVDREHAQQQRRAEENARRGNADDLPADQTRVVWHAVADFRLTTLILPAAHAPRQSARADVVDRAADQLQAGYGCRRCDAAGTIIRPADDAAMSCPRCQGERYEPGDNLIQLLHNLTQRLALLPPDDPLADDAARNTHDALLATLEPGIDHLAHRLNDARIDQLQRQLRRGNIAGTPLALVGNVVGVGSLPQDNRLVVALTVEDRLFIVSHLKTASMLRVGEPALFGGVIGQFITLGPEAVPVVPHGYILQPHAEPQRIVTTQGTLHDGIAARIEQMEVPPPAQPVVRLRSFEDFIRLVPPELRQGDTTEETARILRAWISSEWRDKRPMLITEGGATDAGHNVQVGVEDGERADTVELRATRIYVGERVHLFVTGRLELQTPEQAERIAEQLKRGDRWQGEYRGRDFFRVGRDPPADSLMGQVGIQRGDWWLRITIDWQSPTPAD